MDTERLREQIVTQIWKQVRERHSRLTDQSIGAAPEGIGLSPAQSLFWQSVEEMMRFHIRVFVDAQACDQSEQ